MHVQTEEDQLNDGFPDDYPVVIHKLRKVVCVSFIISTSLSLYLFTTHSTLVPGVIHKHVAVHSLLLAIPCNEYMLWTSGPKW